MHTPECTVVIPQYGRCELTIDCVESLREAEGRLPEILVVDDGSPPEELARLQGRLGGTVRLLARPHQGVTAAWNAALAATSSPRLVFLNNDTLSYGPWLDSLLTPLRTGCARMTGVAWRREQRLPSGLQHPPADGRLLAGWCFALERTELVSLSGFDASLRRYFSDTDLQLRLLAAHAGQQPLVAIEGLPVVHLGHATAHRLNDRVAQWKRDHQRFQAKWRVAHQATHASGTAAARSGE